MKQDVLGTVRSLVRLAAESPPENIEEARNAALQACRLIHKLLKESGSELFVGPASATVDEPVTIEDLFVDLFGNEQPTKRGGSRTRPAASSAPPRQHQVARPKPKRPPDPDAKSIPVLDPAFCQGCGQRILRGRFAMWSRGSLFHPTCWKNETE